MPLIKLQFLPGIRKDGSRYSSGGGWADGDKVRFRQGFPEKIGGWQKQTFTPFAGTARALHPWADLEGNTYLGIGTNLKYYISPGDALYDITPLRNTATLTDPFTTEAGSAVVVVEDAAHGAIEGDYVTFSGADAVGGITINGEYRIDTIIDGNSYTITARPGDFTPGLYGDRYLENGVDARALEDGVLLRETTPIAETETGGGTVTAEYQINTGLNTTVYSTGWGAGGWGGVTPGATDTGWGEAPPLTVVGTKLRLWSQDNFGEDLIINPRDGAIYYWTQDDGLTDRAVLLSSLAGATDVPALARQVLIAESDRKLIAFGCTDLVSGQQDLMLIRWSSTEMPQDFSPREDNTAGGFRIPTGTEFICAMETKQEILVWSDAALHSMRYIGPPYQYGITRVGLTNVVGPNAPAAANDMVFWMGQNGFYFYDGRVNPLPCPVKDHVFNDFNWLQADKVCGGTNLAFNEVWWFYCSESSEEVDKYCCFNYAEQVWHIGTLARTAWIDRSIEDYPRAAGLDGYIYFHEIGEHDGSTNPPSGIAAYIESGPVEIAQGNQFGFAWRMIPDVSFRNSEDIQPTRLFMTLKGEDYPGADWATDQTKVSTVSRSVILPIEQFTQQTYFRLRARSLTLRVESSDGHVAWRLGIPRIDVRADGMR